MKLAIAELESISAYSQSAPHGTEKLDKELPDAFEKRTWRNKAHADDAGKLFIPPMAFANCIKDAAQFLSLKIPGQRNATWTKEFAAGVMVTDPLPLDIAKDAVAGEWVYCNSDGKRNGGSRVWRCFPVVQKWSGPVTFHVVNDKITEDVFKQILTAAGMLIGIGRFRPINRGYYGRFKVNSVKWQAITARAA
jgi:hypothetical protein